LPGRDYPISRRGKRINICVSHNDSVTPNLIRRVLRTITGWAIPGEPLDDSEATDGQETELVTQRFNGGPVVAELRELQEEAEDHLHPTDLAWVDGPDAEMIGEDFGSWRQACRAADLPVSEPSMFETVSRELHLYRATHEVDQVSLYDLFINMKDRLWLLFDEKAGIRTMIRRELKSIEAIGKIKPTHTVDVWAFDSDEPLTTYGMMADGYSPSVAESMVAEISNLERKCRLVETQLEDDSRRVSKDMVTGIKQEVGSLRDHEKTDQIGGNFLRRVEEVNGRILTAERAAKQSATSTSDGETSEQRDKVADRSDEAPSTETREMLDELVFLAESFGESPKADTVGFCGNYTAQEYRQVFGSWERALIVAELEPIDEASRARRQYGRVEILQELMQVQDDLGRRPQRKEMDDADSISSATVAKRMGGW
jgi:hypothetical protein